MNAPQNVAKTSPRVLSSLQQIKDFFAHNQHPYFYIGASHFNVLTLENWVKNWTHVYLIDSVTEPGPQHKPVANTHQRTFDSIESISEFILNHRTFLQMLADVPAAKQVALLTLFLNPEIESMAQSLGLRMALPSHALRNHLDNKIVTTQLGESVQVPSVPNIIAKVRNYASLQSLAKQHHLGGALVVQLAYGDSGKTTYFIESAKDFAEHAVQIRAADAVKIMKRINCRSLAVEAVATRCGTFVGPITDELVGHPALTPYAGGWCGNQILPNALDITTRQTIIHYTEKLGDALYQQGYKGGFEVDYLLDRDTDEVYLGELNPRLTGITALTSLSQFCQTRVPLLLLHLLEFRDDAELALDPQAFNQQSAEQNPADTLGQLIVKYTDEEVRSVIQVPPSGIYQRHTDNSLQCVELTDNPLKATQTGQIFLLNLLADAQQVFPGLDMAILFTRDRLQDPNFNLSNAANTCIQQVRTLYPTRPLNAGERHLLRRYAGPASIKNALMS